jgi:thiosulfate reductase cytochrome b subunit
MNGKQMIYLYSRFERLWHWLQGGLIAMLLLTGFEAHGAYALFGFERAYTIHNWCAWTWVVGSAFAIFWLLITGEWKQYTPTTRKVAEVIRYYLVGIFRGEPHPVPKTLRAKHNPLQRLTYLSLAALLLPLQMATGLLYYFYNSWPEMGLAGWHLQTVAVLHTLGGFALLVFLIVHVYMTTTGHTPWAHIKGMLTGWEEVEHPEAVQDWEKKSA